MDDTLIDIYIPHIKECLKLDINYLYKDKLTDLYNRLFFDFYLNKIISEGNENIKCTYLILLDVDGLKFYNEKYGYEIGNQILKNIGNVLLLLKKDNYFFARFDSDCFAIILNNCSYLQIKNIVDFLSQKINDIKITCDNNNVENIKTLIGIIKLNIGENFNNFINKCDLSMFANRNPGKGGVFYLQS